jgi:hypothetical protein
VGWLVFALMAHLLLMRQLSTGFQFQEDRSFAPLTLKVELNHRIAVEPKPPAPALPSADESVPTTKAPPAKEEKAERLRPEPQPEVIRKSGSSSSPSPAEIPVPPPKINAQRLKESLRSYRLPKQEGKESFTQLLPQGLDAGVFSANTAARINARIREYDGRGGAEVVRVRRFGQKDRCYLVHRVGFEVEREDWDPGMETMVGYGAEEIPCE